MYRVFGGLGSVCRGIWAVVRGWRAPGVAHSAGVALGRRRGGGEMAKMFCFCRLRYKEILFTSQPSDLLLGGAVCDVSTHGI